jgi:hypothetical protein
MAKKRTEQKQIEKAIQIGEENRRLVADVSRWCEHLKIHVETAGMLAAMYKLPIGMLSIECPHSTGSMGGMQLKHIATDFVIRNCIECNHHKEIHSINFGRAVVEKHKRLISQKTSRQNEGPTPLDRIKALKLSKVESSLQTADVTEQSILKLVSLLAHEQHRESAAAKLLQASRLAPTYFNELALEAISVHLSEPSIRSNCIKTLAAILESRPEKPQYIFKAAFQELPFSEEVSILFRHYVTIENLRDFDFLIRAIIDRCSFPAIHFDSRPLPTYPSAISFLSYTYGLDQMYLTGIFTDRLKVDDKASRIRINRLLQQIGKQIPGAVVPLLDRLFYSFDFDDDIYEDSADAETKNTIAQVFFNNHSEVIQSLNRCYDSLSTEAKALSIGVFETVVRKVIFSYGYDDRNSVQNDPRLKSFSIFIPFLIQCTTALKYPVEVKIEASETLELIAKHCPNCLLTCIDPIIGALPILIDESEQIGGKKGNSQLETLEIKSRTSMYQRVCANLLGSIKALVALNPTALYGTFGPMLSSLDSKKQSRFKGQLVYLLAPVIKAGTEPGALSALYRCLMD